MLEINYDYPKLNDFSEKIQQSFEGIDSVIKAIELKKESLEQELSQINTLNTFTSESFKIKAELPRIIREVNDGLGEAQNERRNIQENMWNSISNEAGALKSEYRRYIDEQLSEQENEISSLLKEVEDKINGIKNAITQMNSTFNRIVTHPVNEVVRANSNKSKVLSVNYYNGTKTLKERVERM